jgi:hypothetical protein
VLAVLCSSGAALPLHGAGSASAHHLNNPAEPDPHLGSADQLFDPVHVHVFELTISAADFSRMPPLNGHGGRGMGGWEGPGTAQGSGYAKVPATLRFDGQEWGSVLLRYKGNSSYRGARTELKRSLKVDFNVGGHHRRFFGLSRINLNNNAFDSSQMREALAYDVFEHADVPAPRTTYARVYITVPGRYEREYAGLFTVVEQIDQPFFERRWGHKVGVLLKPEGLSGLPDLGNDWKSYATSYTAKVPTRASDARRMMAFIRFVDHSAEPEFERHLGDYLDVDEFLRFLAVEVMIVNSDSPLAMNHNYYLTIQPDTHKVVWIPWDMNMAFGGFRRGEVNLSLLHPSAPGMFPLADRVLASPVLRERYRQVVRALLESDMTRERMVAKIHGLADVIHNAVVLDPSTSAAQFDANFIERPRPPAQGEPANGDFGGFAFRDRDGPPLIRFVDNRIESLHAQLDGKRDGVPGRAGFGFGP